MNTSLGAHHSGADITRVTLTGSDLTVGLLTLGSILESVRLGEGPNMTVPPPTLRERPDDEIFIGPIVGPVVNRLTLPVDVAGQTLDLAPTGPEGYVLHSGDGGTSDRVWDIADQTESRVTFAIDLADGLGGFPGNRRITATWTLDGPTLALDIRATTDAPTLMNVAHHPYWALDGAGRDGHRLESPATRYTPCTPVFTPTGEVRPVAGSDYDFTSPASPPPTLDANLILGDTDSATPQHAATLTSAGGRRLEVRTTAPGIQVFTGKPYGIALEPQRWPNAPAHDGFPPITLAPGAEFRQQTTYRFSTI